MALKLSTFAANQLVNVWASLLDGGRLCIYAGASPSSVDGVAESAPLVEVPLPSLAFKEAIDRKAQSFPIQKGVSAIGSGTMSWFRGVTADGQTVLEGDVGLPDSAAVLRMPALGLSQGVLVDLEGWELRLPL